MRSMALTIGVAGAAALFMASPGRADAAHTVAVTRGTLNDGPLLVGSDVAWSETRCLTGCDSEEPDAGASAWTLRLAAPGRRPATLTRRRLSHSEQAPSSSTHVQMSFDASATRLALLRLSRWSDEFAGEGAGVSLMGGPLHGRLTKLVSCSAREGADIPSFAFDLDGDLLAYDARPCDAEVERPVVRDLRLRKAVGLPLASGRAIARFALAGDYVALATAPPAPGAWPDAVAVHDAGTGRPLYTVAMPLDEVLHGMDLGPDGTLAVVSSSARNEPQSVFCATSSLRLYTPEQSSGRRLAARPCSGLVALAGSSVLHVAGAGRRSTLTAANAEGERRRILRFGSIRLHGVDADARRIAYALRLCSGRDRLIVSRAAEPPADAGSPRCRASLAARRLVASPSGRLQVPLRCPRGCDGFLYVSSGHRDLVFEERFRLSPGRRHVPARLGPGGRRLLRSRGKLRVKVSLAVYDRAFDYRVVNRPALLLQG
jgi:hypothetical protein